VDFTGVGANVVDVEVPAVEHRRDGPDLVHLGAVLAND
jgi:hypothetical protein